MFLEGSIINIIIIVLLILLKYYYYVCSVCDKSSFGRRRCRRGRKCASAHRPVHVTFRYFVVPATRRAHQIPFPHQYGRVVRVKPFADLTENRAHRISFFPFNRRFDAQTAVSVCVCKHARASQSVGRANPYVSVVTSFARVRRRAAAARRHFVPRRTPLVRAPRHLPVNKPFLGSVRYPPNFE